ncbi:lipid-A-disaccharide synthase-related protein [Leptolyngbya sp. PCC 6406]|uniref:lipid-A-disaccharide synthase-related protein n=1 Tax=Leptolyngbya sp. PCC 6406 TaxID=1173264 RepID=UPI0002ACDA3A|nr:lipid-A-disaccharide synthase-related protein [Leptolyngbya sp. PCC 6406]
MGQQILFLSNGHGEDLNATLILSALRTLAPQISVAAMPIVGVGQAYANLGVPIIGPTQSLPSGGFNYINFGRFLNPANWGRDTNPLSLLRDLGAGLIGLTWGQIRAVQRYSRQCDLLFATGDIVPILFASITGRPFGVFLVSTSSYYEGTVRLPLLVQIALRSRRCRHIFTRDAYTAEDLQRRGFQQAVFAGYPIMDVLTPSGQTLRRDDRPLVALLPGSRLPEAAENLGLMLGLCRALNPLGSFHAIAALVPGLTPDQVIALATAQGWEAPQPGLLVQDDITVQYVYDAFADLLHQCDVVVGMAGTAVEQAVGLGKPVVQIPGAGPQFTYLFAEAQMRLLGPAVQTIGTTAATSETLEAAARVLHEILQDTEYRQRCQTIGQERVGPPGGSTAIARLILASTEGRRK